MHRKLFGTHATATDSTPHNPATRIVTHQAPQLRLDHIPGPIMLSSSPTAREISVTIKCSDRNALDILFADKFIGMADDSLSITAAPLMVLQSNLLSRGRLSRKSRQRFAEIRAITIELEVIVPEGTDLVLEKLKGAVIAPDSVLGNVTISAPYTGGNIVLGTTKSLAAKLEKQLLTAKSVRGEVLSITGGNVDIADGAVKLLFLNGSTSHSSVHYGGTAESGTITGSLLTKITVEQVDGYIVISAPMLSTITINSGQATSITVDGENGKVQYLGIAQTATVNSTENLKCTFRTVSKLLQLNGQGGNVTVLFGDTKTVNAYGGRFEHNGIIHDGNIVVPRGTTCLAKGFGPNVKFQGIMGVSTAAVGFDA